MAVAVAERVERPLSLFGPGAEGAGEPDRDGALRGGPTLDDAIVGAWEGLAARAVVACPLCGGALAPRIGAPGREAPAGRCGRCGTTLA
jgi:hypothetical protein